MSLENGLGVRRSLLASSTKETVWQAPRETLHYVRFVARLSDNGRGDL